jgi:hypothetical protein
MRRTVLLRLKYRALAFCKLCLSVRKHDWNLGDYPVVIKKQEVDPAYLGTRLNQPSYSAQILNWGLVGFGDSPSEASRELEQNFARARMERVQLGQSMPRPGVRVPVQFASQNRIQTHPELVQDFVHRILGLQWAWISDESSLWDFHHDHTNDVLNARIKMIYGVDVSDIQSANLSEILERIAAGKPLGNIP